MAIRADERPILAQRDFDMNICVRLVQHQRSNSRLFVHLGTIPHCADITIDKCMRYFMLHYCHIWGAPSSSGRSYCRAQTVVGTMEVSRDASGNTAILHDVRNGLQRSGRLCTSLIDFLQTISQSHIPGFGRVLQLARGRVISNQEHPRKNPIS